MRSADGSLTWIDLVDPDESAITSAWEAPLDDSTMSVLCAQAVHDDLPRPRFWPREDSIVAVVLLPILVDNGDEVIHQEIDLVLTQSAVLTVRKTPRSADGSVGGQGPYDPSDLEEMLQRGTPLAPGKLALIILDDVAEAFLDLIDELIDRIDFLEDRVESSDFHEIQHQISNFRHDLLHLRRLVAPTRDAVRRVVDGRVEVRSGSLFPRELELEFGDVYDKLLRAGDALETARELVGGVRDYVQTKVANDQNDVMKRLTAAASILLVPTFIVGLYGQNFRGMPELRWRYGYVFSWTLIIVATWLQLWWFRRKKWI